ncbi:MAG: large ribosomal subunit protein bL35 [Candidatus Dojkabacteria bacterium]
MKKYKLKTHKSTSKRFKLTGTGKIKRAKQQMRNNAHRKNKSAAQRKLNPEVMVITSKGNVKKIKRLLNA